MRISACHRGFSLVELMAACAITAIIMGMAVPGFRGFALNSQRAASINDLLASLQMARSTAWTQARYVTVCSSRDGATCSSAAADWSRGWLVYINADHEVSGVEPDAGETVLRYFPNHYAAVHVSSGGRRAFTFRPFQLNSDNGTLTICDERAASKPQERRAIIVNTVGRPRVSERKSDGSPLDCV